MSDALSLRKKRTKIVKDRNGDFFDREASFVLLTSGLLQVNDTIVNTMMILTSNQVLSFLPETRKQFVLCKGCQKTNRL